MLPFEITKQEMRGEENKMMTINLKPMKYEFITSVARLYVAQKYTAAVSIMPITENKINFNVIWGMGGQDFTVDISRHMNKSTEELFDFIIEKIDRYMK